MYKIDYQVQKDLEPFVNCIWFGESLDHDAHTKIPLYADGYPGIMFQQSENGFYLFPKGKKLSEFYLYGQTIDPISLEAKGKHHFIVFQLFPFASKYLLGVDPKVLNDECYDLLQLEAVKPFEAALKGTRDLDQLVHIISEVMRTLIQVHQVPTNDQIQHAIALILKNDGVVKINKLLNEVYLSERSFERQFKAQTGLSPKQFARIIQFQKSLNQLNEANFNKLTEVGLDNGFSDQSHFIRTFKNYTGQTPSFYLRNRAS